MSTEQSTIDGEAIDSFTAPVELEDAAVAVQITELMSQLAVRHRAKAAYRALFALGFAVVPAAREGLHHENTDVRYYCCSLLDHFLLPEALGDLIDMLRDSEPQVRGMALHTLACDRCKQGECRPAAADVLPEALRVLTEDSDAHVRAMAVEVVGQYVHTNPSAERALVQANQNDPSPAVRKKAGWYAPRRPNSSADGAAPATKSTPVMCFRVADLALRTTPDL